MTTPANEATLALVKEFEGLYLEAYLCPAGVWTIGYGHTGKVHKDGTVHHGRKITAAEAEQLLLEDLAKFRAGLEKRILPLVWAKMNENMIGALTSFCFNLGLGNFEGSTLRARVNAKRWLDCLPEFAKWTRADGQVLRGLVRRRAAEAALFCSFPR